MSREIARCDEEISRLKAQPADIPDKAFLVAMGIRDWEAERQMLRAENQKLQAKLYAAEKLVDLYVVGTGMKLVFTTASGNIGVASFAIVGTKVGISCDWFSKPSPEDMQEAQTKILTAINTFFPSEAGIAEVLDVSSKCYSTAAELEQRAVDMRRFLGGGQG